MKLVIKNEHFKVLLKSYFNKIGLKQESEFSVLNKDHLGLLVKLNSYEMLGELPAIGEIVYIPKSDTFGTVEIIKTDKNLTFVFCKEYFTLLYLSEIVKTF